MSRRTDEPGSNVRIDNWLDAVEQMDMGPLNHCTCTEVTALADLMHFYRGEEKAMWVILHHFWNSDEEEDELREHLEEWPGLRAAIREVFSEDSEVFLMLNELEGESNE
jgi:hypothetical protein